MTTTRGQRGSWLLIGGLALAAAAQPFAGCSDGSSDGPFTDDTDGGSVVHQLLAQVGPGVVLPALQAFRAEAVALQEAVDRWEASLAPGGDAHAARLAQAEAQQAFLTAMAAWQELEVMQVGPAGSSLHTPGGADLRDAIYSWPTVNRCRVDQETVKAAWRDPGFLDENVNVLGLDALEVLLFSPPLENGCFPHLEPNKSGAWEALGEVGIAEHRAGYAATLAAGVVTHTDALLDAWSPDGGDFGALLASPGAEGSPYADETEALNAVFRALFYVETLGKDRKLAWPLGLRDCSGDPCADQVETRMVGHQAAWIAANLRGFRALFTGGDGAGFDDLLGSIGEGQLADDILAAVDAAEATLDAFAEPLDEAIRADRDAVQALHDALKVVTDDVKGDLATVLLLQIPSEAAGDND